MKVLDIYGTKTTIQSFDDKKLNRPLTHVAWYNKAQCRAWNKEGAGIFWTLNPQEQEGKRGIELTYQFACFGLDCDVTKETDGKRNIARLSEEDVQRLKKELLEKLLSLPVKPTIIIETRNGLQPVWVWEKPFSLHPHQRANANEKYKLLVKGFTKATGITSEGDQIQRVLRLPGFFHKKSDTDFLIKEIYNGEPCKYTDFIKAYPPEKSQTKEKPKKNISQPSDKLEHFPIQQALEKISGQGFVGGEKYTFKSNSNGTVQIVVNGTATGKFIDPVQNTIGGTNEAGPTIIQWVKWYFEQTGDSEKIAYAKTYQILYPLLLPHVPPELWNRNVQKEHPTSSMSNTFTDVILPELDPEKIAKALVNKDFMNGIQTGYKYFDLTTGGFKRQFSYLLAARSKNLKSMLSVNLLFRVARKGIPVAYFDLENGDFLGNKRLVQIYTGWSNQEMQALEDDPQGTEKVQRMVEKMKQELPFTPIYDLGELGKEEPYHRVVRMIRKLVEKRNVRVVAIDNLNVFVDASKNDQNQYKAQIITAFDAIAVELNISVIIVHHATDKERVNEGLKLENFLENKPMDVFIPHISKTLGTSAAISKTKVGMTMAHDSLTGMLYIWVQTNRDGPQDKRFSLFFNKENKRIYNNAQEAMEQIAPIDADMSNQENSQIHLQSGNAQQIENDGDAPNARLQDEENDYFEIDTLSDTDGKITEQTKQNETIELTEQATTPRTYFGTNALTVLRKAGVIQESGTSCSNPFQTARQVKQLWVQSESGKYQWLPKKGITCGSILFYQSANSDEIFCASCKPCTDEKNISSWYQTTTCNIHKQESYRFTYAERAYWDSKKYNLSGSRSNGLTL